MSDYPKTKRTGYWLRNPREARDEETIGGGYFVFRRGRSTGRVRPSNWPFEHATPEAAMTEAVKLSKRHPGERFEVFGLMFAAAAPAEDVAPNEEAA